MVRRVASLLRTLVRRTRFEDGMAEELQFHLDAYVADLVASGVSADEARRRARLEFGNVDAVKGDCRAARGLRVVDAVLRDARHALRRMRRSPGFTIAALGTIAICLGVNLALFAVVDSVLLRALPFPDADRLVTVFNTYPRAGVPNDGVSLTNYYERRTAVRAFSRLAIVRQGAAIVGETGATEREAVAHVSHEFFETLGMLPARGRAFTDAEMAFGADAVAIVSDAYWRHVLGSDPGVIGRRVRVDGRERVIVGVLPPGFAFLSSPARLYLPLASAPEQRGPERRHWGSQAEMVARLAPGTTVGEAQAEMDAHNAAVERGSLEAATMAAAGFRSLVVPLHAHHVAEVRPTLMLVQSGALLLLVISGVNLATLLLIRAGGRLKELAVRQALGASRGQVIAEVMVETLVLVLAGGVLGLAVGAVGLEGLERLGADRLPLGARIAFDGRAASAAITAALVMGVAMAIPIAWYSVKAAADAGLHGQSRTTTASRASGRLRHGFVVAQMALAFVLLAGASMLALSLQKVTSLSAGFRPGQATSARIAMPWASYQDIGARVVFTDRVIDALARQPGVAAVGIATNVPLSGDTTRSAATVYGRRARPGEPPHAIYSFGVWGDYFAALGIPLREGRFLDDGDARLDRRTCVVDEAFARRHFPAGQAVGQRLFMGGQEGPEAEAFTVVGVVGAVKQESLTEDGTQGAVFYPYPYRGELDVYVVARSTLPPEAMASVLQRVVRSIDGDVPVADLRTMDARIDDSLLVRRSPALLAALFAAVALLLTAIGTYGVLSHAVTLRRREIALRIALGARPRQMRAHFLALACRLVAFGTVLGAAGAYGAGQALQALLFEVPPLHGPTLAGTTAVVVLVGIAACLLPAERAARTSPLAVLAEE